MSKHCVPAVPNKRYEFNIYDILIVSQLLLLLFLL